MSSWHRRRAGLSNTIWSVEWSSLTTRNTGELVEFWLEEMVRHTDWLAGELQFRTDETARLGRDRLSPRLSCTLM